MGQQMVFEFQLDRTEEPLTVRGPTRVDPRNRAGAGWADGAAPASDGHETHTLDTDVTLKGRENGACSEATKEVADLYRSRISI